MTSGPPRTLQSGEGARFAGTSGSGHARELSTLLVATIVYFGGRVLVEGTNAAAIRNAERLLDVERALGIDIEADVQQLALDHDVLRVLGNLSYVWLHWPLLIAVLWLLFRTDRRHYRQLRNAMFLSGAIGLFFFAFLPTAPPRFMPGFVGTVSDAARRHYLGYPLDWSNRFAAFPSFHAGWTLIACLALASSIRSKGAKAIALTPAALVAVSVVSTGNHYVLDGTAGILIALGAYLYFGRSATTESDMQPPGRAGSCASAAHDARPGAIQAVEPGPRRRPASDTEPRTRKAAC